MQILLDLVTKPINFDLPKPDVVVGSPVSPAKVVEPIPPGTVDVVRPARPSVNELYLLVLFLALFVTKSGSICIESGHG